MDVLHRGSDLVTSSSTPLLTGLPPEARVRLMDGAAVVGAEAGRDTARFDFALGQVGAGCWALDGQRARDVGCTRRERRCPTVCTQLLPALACCLHPRAAACPQLNASRFVALGRTSLWWMTPKWGSSAAEVRPSWREGRGRHAGWVQAWRRRPQPAAPMWPAPAPAIRMHPPSADRQVPEETQFLLAELPAAEGGQGGSQGYALLLPLIDGGTFRATLRPPTRCAHVPGSVERQHRRRCRWLGTAAMDVLGWRR